MNHVTSGKLFNFFEPYFSSVDGIKKNKLYNTSKKYCPH